MKQCKLRDAERLHHGMYSAIGQELIELDEWVRVDGAELDGAISRW